jgi:hypothetical protein
MISERVLCAHHELSSPESSDTATHASNTSFIHFCMGMGDK